MKNNKGFTLVELIGVIIIFSIISVLAFTSFTKMMKNMKLKDLEEFKDTIINSATLYVEMNLNDYASLNEVGGELNLPVVKLKADGYLDDIKSIDSCSIDTAVINVKKNEDNSLSYNVNCDSDFKCIRGNTLHSLTMNGETTIYGQIGAYGTLKSGDVFDCDINDDGTYDAETERFYYISDYYNTNTKTFEANKAVLLYYKNMSGNITYNSNNINYLGPVNALTKLPKKTDWVGFELFDETRQILTEKGGLATAGGTLPTAFSYEGYAARLLTTQELAVACPSITIGRYTKGDFEPCMYFLENTLNSVADTMGYWLETPVEGSSTEAFLPHGDNLMFFYSANYTGYGTRAAIEVLKTDMLY